MQGIRANWVRKVEAEEGLPFLEVVRRERQFNVPHNVIADSFEIAPKTYHAMLERLRKKGIDV